MFTDKDDYPFWFSSKQKEAFDEVRKLAKRIDCAEDLLVEKEGFVTVYIEIAGSSVKSYVNDLIDSLPDNFPLIVSVAPSDSIEGGFRYGL